METSGLILDRKLVNTRQSAWVDALNMYRNVVTDTLDVESGFTYDSSCITTKYPVIGRISCNDEYILFCTDNANSQIVSSRLGVIIDDNLLAFNNTNPITGVYTYNHKGELVITWTDNDTSPKILNIDNIPFALNNDKSIVDITKFTLLELFPVVTEPLVTVTQILNTGSLPSAVYYITTAYGFKDESTTNWLYKHNPISIIDDSNLLSFNEINGCSAGTITNKAIACNISNLDFNFEYLQVGVIVKTNSIITAYKLNSYQLSQDTTNINIIISSLTNATPITLTDVLSNNAIYTKCKTLTTLNNELLIANTTGLPILDYQEFANNIQVNWIRNRIVSYDGVETSYKNSIVIYNSKSFRAGEVYGLLIGLKLKQTGTYALFHIPGRAANNTDKDAVVDTELLKLDSNLKCFQVYDTSNNTDIDSGTMGYWENTNEVYPSWFPNISDTNEVLANTPVRHHRFPTLSALHTYSNPLVYDQTALGLGENTTLLSDGTYLYGSSRTFKYANSAVTELGYFDTYNTRYHAIVKQNVAINLNFKVHLVVADVMQPVGCIITVKDSSYTPISSQYRELTLSGINYTLVDTLNYSLNPGDIVRCEVSSQKDFVTDSVVHSSWNVTSINTLDDIEGTVYTKPLGIRLDNIVIPSEIRDYISGYEIFYYERDNDNMTILDQSVLQPKSHGGDPFIYGGTTDEFKFNGFSSCSNQIALRPSYLSCELNLTPVDMTRAIVGLTEGWSGNWNAVTPTITNIISDKLKIVEKIQYLPANNILSTFTNDPSYNLSSEDGFYIKTSTDVILPQTTLILANVCAYKTDMYLGFMNRRVVSTGSYINISDSDLQLTTDIYGGDTFINKYSFLTYYNSILPTNVANFNKSFVRTVITIPCESSSNIGFRHEGIQSHEKYYPKSNVLELVETAGVYSGIFWDMWQAGNSYLYNTDYNSINNITSPYIWNNSPNFTDSYTNRIHRSLPMNSESTELKWRVFPSRNYYDMPYGKGAITKLLTHGQALFIGLENTTYKAFVKDLLSTLNTDAYLTRGDIFDRIPTEIIDSQEGIIGVQYQEAMISTPHGVFILDVEQCKAYLLNEGINPLNISDAYEYFKEHLNFDNNNYVSDNIYHDTGVALGYSITDNTRLFVTARNKKFYYGLDRITVLATTGYTTEQISYYPDTIVLNITQLGDAQDCTITIELINGTIDLIGSTIITGLGYFSIEDTIVDQINEIYNAIVASLTDLQLLADYTLTVTATSIYIIANNESTATNHYGCTTINMVGIGYGYFQDCVLYYDKSFTLTYSLDNKYWVSKHTYIPTNYIQLRKGTFCVDGNMLLPTNKIYNMNGTDIAKYTQYCNGLTNAVNNIITINPSYIDFIFNFSQGQSNFRLDVVKWISKAYLNNKLQRINTFDKLMVYTEEQCSDYIILTHVTGKQVGTLEYNNNEWYCGNIRDMLLPNNDATSFLDFNNQPISAYFHLGEVTTLIAGNKYMVTNVVDTLVDSVTYNSRIMNYNGATFIAKANDLSYTILGEAKIINIKQWFDMSEIYSKFTAIRLYSSNTNQLDIKLLQVTPLIKNSL